MSSSVQHRRSRAEWKQLNSEFEKSKLSRSAFCKQRGINLTSFSRWYGKLVETPKDFIDVTPAKLGAKRLSTPAWAVELELPNGIKLRIA